MTALKGKWTKLYLYCTLFFFMSFVNAILDSTKDTLVVTALGGAEQIPYLTVYAVLPASLAFVAMFSAMSIHMSRSRLFYLVLSAFMSFFAVFTFVLYPNAEALQPTGLCNALMSALPAGASGAVAVLRNWISTLFYVFAELWGDVVLSLLFWGCANEHTRMEEAHVLYPLFGIGANIAQALAGRVLKLLPAVLPGLHAGGAAWTVQLQVLMCMVGVCCFVIAGMHFAIDRVAQLRGWGGASAAEEKAEAERLKAAAEKAGREEGSGSGEGEETKRKVGLRESFALLGQSRSIQCLALMAIAQGLSSNVFQVAWKGQLRNLYPGPSEYSAFMGDVATISGVVTGLGMVAAPSLFARLGWSGVASCTPILMLGFGALFFAGAIYACAGGAASGVAAPHLLVPLCVGGAALYIFEKAAKFSLFKPAEEIVYLSLDSNSRTKGKAAVDVLGAQTGKSVGSLFQQGLLVAFGNLSRALPALWAAHFGIVSLWIWAVDRLARHSGELLRRPGTAQDDPPASADLVCDLDNGNGHEPTPKPA